MVMKNPIPKHQLNKMFPTISMVSKATPNTSTKYTARLILTVPAILTDNYEIWA